MGGKSWWEKHPGKGVKKSLFKNALTRAYLNLEICALFIGKKMLTQSLSLSKKKCPARVEN